MATHLERPTASPVATGRTEAAPSRGGYLYQLDFVRTITFLLVVFIHTLTNTNDEVNGTVTNAIAMNLHFTRNAFFALTGLVLAYGIVERGARLSPVRFWRKRLTLVITPFVLWAFAYWVYDMVVGGNGGQIPHQLGDFWNSLKWGGTNGYQLYFIFVTLQIYLLFPLIFAFAERTRRFHAPILAVSAVLQVGIYVAATYWNPTTGWWGENFWHLYATFVPYQFFILLGVFSAFHRERIEAVLLRHAPLIFAAAALVALGAQVLYRVRLSDETAPIVASAVFQPANFVLYVVLVAAVYTVGLLLARNRHRLPRLTRFASYGAKRSFGVFLVHVMVLSTLLLPRTVDGEPWLTTVLPSPFGTAVAYALTIAITLRIVELLSRAPKAQWWVGRPRPAKRKRPAPQAEESLAGIARTATSGLSPHWRPQADPVTDDSALFTIGDVAARTGASVKTIRFWSDEGLVPTVRSTAGYRLYDAESVARLELVRTLRALGLDVKTVRAVLAERVGLAAVADAHAKALDAEIRTLRIRRAVLRSVATRNSTTEELRIMHEMATLSAAERQRIIDGFVDEAFAGIAPDAPGAHIANGMRSMPAELPDDPTPAQVDAWIELAALVADEDFRARAREMAVTGAAATAPPVMVDLDAARAAVEAGTPPESAEAAALLATLLPEGTDRAATAEQMVTFTDARVERYWSLLGVLNGWPQRPAMVPVAEWVIAALRAHA